MTFFGITYIPMVMLHNYNYKYTKIKKTNKGRICVTFVGICFYNFFYMGSIKIDAIYNKFYLYKWDSFYDCK